MTTKRATKQVNDRGNGGPPAPEFDDDVTGVLDAALSTLERASAAGAKQRAAAVEAVKRVLTPVPAPAKMG
jgi:hypothetical protein